MKTCTGCSQTKSRSDFPRRATSPDGLAYRCKECTNAASRSWSERNPDRRAVINRAYRERHAAVLPARERANNLLYRYGITDDEYDAMVEVQQGRCAVCRQEPDGRLFVDHDHRTGQNRGLLCHNCNLGLGHFKDDPDVLRAALDYLEASCLRT